MHDHDPSPCTSAAFGAGEHSAPKLGAVVSAERVPEPGPRCRLSLGGSWLLDVPVLVAYLSIGGYAGISSGGSSKAIGTLANLGAPGLVGAVVVAVLTLATMLRERDVDLLLLPSGLLALRYQSALRQRCTTVPVAEIRAVAIVEVVNEDSSTWRTRLMKYGIEHVDLGVAEGTAARVAAFLGLPLERHSDGAPPYVLAEAGATLNSDA